MPKKVAHTISNITKNRKLRKICTYIFAFIGVIASVMFLISVFRNLTDQDSFAMPSVATKQIYDTEFVEAPNFARDSAPVYNQAQEIEPDATQPQTYKVYNANISVVVKDITEYKNLIQDYVISNRGYIVSENISSSYSVVPDFEEGIFLNSNQEANKVYKLYMVVRVPTKELNDFIKFLQENAVDTLNVQINGTDITEEYQDLQRELKLYETTYTRLQDIYNKASKPQDLLDIQAKMLNTQRRIDQIKGRIKAIEQRSKTAKVTINATTDKYSLSYVPHNIWDIKTTLKLAIRALMTTLAFVAKSIIWVLVFSPIIAVTVLAVRFAWKKLAKFI